MSISRRQCLALAAVAGSVPLPTFAQSGSVHIFMVLGRGESANEVGFREYLRRQGFNVRYTVRNTSGDLSKIPDIIAEIRAAKPDLIYTWGTPQTLAIAGPWDAQDTSGYIRDIPIVFCFVSDPVATRIVPDLRQPRGNVTGTIHIAPINAQINTLIAYRKSSKIGVIYNPEEENSVTAVKGLRDELHKRGIEVLEAMVTLDAERKPLAVSIRPLIDGLAKRGAQFLYIGPDTFVANQQRAVVAEAALLAGLPTFSATELIVRENSALLALASSSRAIGAFTALKATQVLDGGRPGDIPVETLRRFSVLINMTTARRLGIYPSISLLNFAEIVDL